MSLYTFPAMWNAMKGFTSYDNARFYRNGSDLLILVATNRSAAVGFKSSEGWETASGVFAHPPGGKAAAVTAVQSAWAANKGANQATLTAAINTALTDAGYTMASGAAIGT